MLPEAGANAGTRNPSTAVQTLPALGGFGCRLGTLEQGLGVVGSSGSSSWGHSAVECWKSPKRHPGAAGGSLGRGGRCCRDTVLRPGPTNCRLHPDLCISRYRSPSEPSLQRILPKQALIPGVSPGLAEQ